MAAVALVRAATRADLTSLDEHLLDAELDRILTEGYVDGDTLGDMRLKLFATAWFVGVPSPSGTGPSRARPSRVSRA